MQFLQFFGMADMAKLLLGGGGRLIRFYCIKMADEPRDDDLQVRRLFADFLLDAEVSDSYTLDEFREFFPAKFW